MATRGRNICNTLKAIRKQIADANGMTIHLKNVILRANARALARNVSKT